MTSQARNRVMIACFFIAAAAGLRFFALERQSLWNDEMFSLEVANLPVSGIPSSLAAHFHHPPLFFIVLHFALTWFGQSAAALRLISATAGALTVGLVFYCASRMYDLRAGILSAAICLVAPFHLAYSQEGRPYALAALLALASFWSLTTFIEKRTPGRAMVYAAISLALLYTHHWGIFVLAAQALYVLLEREITPAAKKPVFLCWLVIAGLYLPEVPALLSQSSDGTSAGWFWVEPPSGHEWYWLAGAFSGTYFKMASSTFDSLPILRFAGAGALVVLVAGMVASAAREPAHRNLRGALACFAGALLIPFLISLVRPEIFLWYRYTVVVFPLLCVAFGAVFRETPRGWWGPIAGGIIILTGCGGTLRYYSWSKSNVREVAAYADSLAGRGTTMVIRPRSFAPLLNYYYHGDAVQYDEAYLDTPLGEIVDTASSFIDISLDVPNTIRDYLDAHFVKDAERRFPGEAHLGMVVTLYRRPPPGNAG